MDLTLTENSETLVTLHVKGKLDGSNYETLAAPGFRPCTARR
jgi:hypothetical protein